MKSSVLSDFFRNLTEVENGTNIFNRRFYRGTGTPYLTYRSVFAIILNTKIPCGGRDACRAPAASSAVWWGREALGTRGRCPTLGRLKSQLQHVAGGGRPGGIADRGGRWVMAIPRGVLTIITLVKSQHSRCERPCSLLELLKFRGVCLFSQTVK